MRIAVDTGGTFTDCVYLSNGELRVLKVFSTPANPAEAILAALRGIGLQAQAEVRPGDDCCKRTRCLSAPALRSLTTRRSREEWERAQIGTAFPAFTPT